MEKVVFKVTNFSASPLTFVGLHTLEIPGSCKDKEFSFPENVANGMIKRLKGYPHIKVTKVAADKNVKAAVQADAKEASVTETTKAAATGAKSAKASSKE